MQKLTEQEIAYIRLMDQREREAAIKREGALELISVQRGLTGKWTLSADRTELIEEKEA
jgi:hypothetical protein